MQSYNLNRLSSKPPPNVSTVSSNHQQIPVVDRSSGTMNAEATGTISGNSGGMSPPEFDFNIPCRYFKSSFARSLSLNNNAHSNASKSLDFDYNNYHRQHHHSHQQQQQSNCLPLPKRMERGAPQNEVKSSSTNEAINDDDEVGVAKSTTPPPPALPVRRPMPAKNNINSSNIKHANGLTLSHYEQEQLTQFRMSSASSSSSNTENINKVINQQQQQQMLPGNNNHVVIINGNNNLSIHRNPQQQQQQQLPIWPRDVINLQQVANNKNYKCNDDNIKNIEPRPASAFELHENTLNVEAVILQNQVDTLQWQLKKVETNCEMYRAVMEEVARFLDRYISHTQQRQQQQQQNRNEQQIARSKSLYHVHAGSNGSSSSNNNNNSGSNGGIHDSMVSGDETLSNSYLRTRSSSNLVGNIAGTNKSMLAISDEHNYEPIAPACSYNAFKDFTWRRAPKKPTGRNAASLCLEDAGEEKLNQEAFRLSRTIQNLLNTSLQQLDLTMPHRNSIAGSHSRLGKAASASIMTLPTANSTILSGGVIPTVERSSTDNVPKPCHVNGATATNINNATAVNATTATTANDMLFLRSTNMRDSRLSLRSSTDSSVHSIISSAASSSSKIETDEDVTHTNAGYVVKPNAGSSTEDESGFSSISSFHDVGIPHSSPLIATSTPRPSIMNGLALNELASNNDLHLADNLNATLKATVASPLSVAATHPNNVIGLPTSSNVGGRWDAIGSATNASPSKTYATKYQRFSTLSNEDAATVLWV